MKNDKGFIIINHYDKRFSFPADSSLNEKLYGALFKKIFSYLMMDSILSKNKFFRVLNKIRAN